MANDYSYPANIWYLTSGFFWNKPVWIKKIVYSGSTAAHTATFGTYNYADTVRATMTGVSCAITDSHLITSAGNFQSAEAVVGDVIWIKEGSATAEAANLGKYMVLSVDSDDAIHVVGDNGVVTPLTNDAAGVYTWVTIAPHIAAKLVVNGTSVVTEHEDFDPPLYLPNFSLYQISSGFALVYFA